MINEAQGYRNQIIPEARGRVAQILFQAEAYRETKVRQARGDANRFLAKLKEYKKAPYITRKRLYLEMMKILFLDYFKIHYQIHSILHLVHLF